MPCALCGDIIPREVVRCPHCGTWARRRDFRAVGVAVFMLLGFNAFIALGAAVSLLRAARPLSTETHDTYDPAAAAEVLKPYADLFVVCALLAGFTGLLYVAWLWRAHRQAPGPHRHHRAWVVLGWLCPVVNLWVPPRVVYDVWVNSGDYRPQQRQAVGAVVVGWWCAMLGALLLARWFAVASVDTLADARIDAHLGVAAAACVALAATLCMIPVFQITRIQVVRP